jgi:hypothetical protein
MLVKKMDKMVAAQQDRRLAAVVNILGEATDRAKKKIYKFGEKHDLQKVPLAITTDGDKFQINDAAAVTVMIYRGRKVKVNYALAEGELDLRTVARIVKSTKKMLNEPAEKPTEKPKGKAKPMAKPKEKPKEEPKAQTEKVGQANRGTHEQPWVGMPLNPADAVGGRLAALCLPAPALLHPA